MKSFKVIFLFEWLKLKRSKGFWVLILLCLIIGLYSLYYGNSEIQRQKKNLAEIEQIQQQTINELKHTFPDNNPAGDIPYYFPLYVVNKPHPLAALSIGQRDVNPYYLKLRLLALEGQLYDSDTINPYKVFNGNFDFSFLVVFVIPLLVIAFSFNVYSEEKEQGTLALLLSNPISVQTLISAKLMLRFLVVLTLVSFLFFVGIFYIKAEVNYELLFLFGAIFLYTFFWFCLSFYVISLKRGTSFNGVTLFGSWLLFVVIVPSLFNIFSSSVEDGQRGIEVTMEQREAVHSGWDLSKDETFNVFFSKYPQWIPYRPKSEGFSWGWYYAFQEVGDLKAEDKVRSYNAQFSEILRKSRISESFSPAVILQNLFNLYSRSDLEAHLRFLNDVRSFHQKMKDFFYPYIFQELGFPHKDYNLVPRPSYSSSEYTPKGLVGIFKLFMACSLFLFLGRREFAIRRGNL